MYTQSIERMQHADKKKKEGLQERKCGASMNCGAERRLMRRLTRHLFDQPRRETKEKLQNLSVPFSFTPKN